jgi:hypothetical protein
MPFLWFWQNRDDSDWAADRVRPSTKVASILYKLDWSTGCEWSARISSEESELLARIVRDYYERLND